MIIILCLFALLANCEISDNVNYPLYKTGLQLTALNPIVTESFKANTKLGAQFAITHIKAIQVCLHRQPLFAISSVLWNVSCQFYYYYPPSPTPGIPITNQDTTFIRNVPYYLGIAYADLNDVTSTDSIDFTLGQTDSSGGPQSSDVCPDGWVFDRYALPGHEQCIKVARNIAINTPTQQISEAFEITYYSFDVPDNVGSIMAASDDTLNQLIFVFRLTCTPSDTRKDGTSGSNAFLEFPRPGKYFLSVKAMSKVTTTFRIRATLCSGYNSTAGPACATPYNNTGLSNLAVLTQANVYQYWSLKLPAYSTTSISLLPNNYDLINYELYASKGQLPQYGNADISNCYAKSCSVIMSMHISTGAFDELWFVSVMSYTTNQTYAIWFNTTCAPGCETHGTCTTTGPSAGLCVCGSQATGAACQLLNTKRAHTIVLIIIAVLLGTSALIGLFASWYLKRHKGYQAV